MNAVNMDSARVTTTKWRSKACSLRGGGLLMMDVEENIGPLS